METAFEMRVGVVFRKGLNRLNWPYGLKTPVENWPNLDQNQFGYKTILVGYPNSAAPPNLRNRQWLCHTIDPMHLV